MRLLVALLSLALLGAASAAPLPPRESARGDAAVRQVRQKDMDKYPSPDGRSQIVVVYGKSGVSAEYRGAAKTRSIFTRLPVPGVSVSWLDDEFAVVAAACGTGCSATYLASSRASAGPFPNVLSTNREFRLFAYVRNGKIVVARLADPSKPVGEAALPDWCPGGDCEFQDGYSRDRYRFSASGGELEVPLPPS
jgi:hypothetical protein